MTKKNSTPDSAPTPPAVPPVVETTAVDDTAPMADTATPWQAAPAAETAAPDKRRRRLSFRTLAHIAASLQMLTRFRLFQDRSWPTDIYRESIAWFPAVGILVGTMGSAIDGIGSIIGLTPFVTAPLAVAAMIWMTGGLHEGGLANFADGTGGGQTAAEKTAIMQDSRIGTYGTLALGLMILTKVGALASLSSSEYVFAGLVVAGAWSRMLMPLAASWMVPVNADDAIAQLGSPAGSRLLIGLILAVLWALLLLDIVAALALLGVGMLVALFFVMFARNQIGGFNRDVLSTIQQCTELAMLVTLVALQD